MQLCALYDLENVRAFLTGLPMTSVGKIPHDELRDQLENEECLISGVPEFFAQYKTAAERAQTPTSAPLFLCRRLSNASPLRPGVLPIRTHEPPPHSLLESRKLGPALLRLKVSIGRASKKSCLIRLSPCGAPAIPIPKSSKRPFPHGNFRPSVPSSRMVPPFSLDHVLAYILQLRILESRREMKTTNHMSTLERIVEAVR